MQQVASDEGMTPITGKATSKPGDVGGLIQAVESKMAELMAWHAQQTKQLETDKIVLEAQAQQQQDALKAQRAEIESERKQLGDFRDLLDSRNDALEKQKQLLADRAEQIDQQRIKLVELTSKLRAEESAMSREWTEVQRERESVQRQATELAKHRERIDERAKAWLRETSNELSQPLKLTGAEPEEDGDATDRNAA